MGLDMYLKASKYVGGWEHSGRPEQLAFLNVLRAIGIPAKAVTQSAPSLTVDFNIAYWRKSNQIHAWFVREVQDGKDECQRSYVPREKLTELRDLCIQVRDTRNSSLLEPKSGFFFGSTNIDEWYWRDIQNTIDQLGAVLANPALKDCEFYYQSSW